MFAFRKAASLGLAAALSASPAAHAASVNWVDWTSVQGLNIFGAIGSGPQAVGVTFEGQRAGSQVLGLGTDYWAEGPSDPYTGGVVNRPDGTDYVGLAQGGLKTITFSKAVTDPYLALFNWKGVNATFDAPFTVVSEGCATLGCGSFTVSGGGTAFDGVDHATGVLQFHGTFDTLTFTDSSTIDVVRGFRVGLAEPSAAPEPAGWILMIAGFGALGAALRVRRAGPRTA